MALLTLSWWPLSPWLSPAAAWFIFFNAVVGAIAVMSSSSSSSSSAQQAAAPSRRRLCRSGSSVLLDRLRSFSIFSVHPAAGSGVTAVALPLDDSGGGSDASDSHCYYCCSRSRQADGAPDAQNQLMRSPMPLDEDAATGGATATSAPVAMAEAEDHVAPAPAPELEPADQEDTAEAEAVLQDDSIGLDEAYALAQRHRAAQPLAPPAASTPTTPSRARSTKNKPAAKVAEAGIRRRAQGRCDGAAAGEALLEGKAELNARAELFIRQFREDLKLQRLNSILRHAQALGSPTAAVW